MTGRRRRRLAGGAVLAWTILAMSGPPALGQGRQVHGESSSFVGHGVALVWGILRGTSEADTRVVLRIAPAGGDYAAVSLDGVDPFSQRRRELLARRPLGSALDVASPRDTFADLPRREIHFYAAGDPHRASLTVYFVGLPDTTPEFASEAALRAYLEETLATLRGR